MREYSDVIGGTFGYIGGFRVMYVCYMIRDLYNYDEDFEEMIYWYQFVVEEVIAFQIERRKVLADFKYEEFKPFTEDDMITFSTDLRLEKSNDLYFCCLENQSLSQRME